MKKLYYDFIKEFNISDILNNIEILSYSQKLKILKNLLTKYSVDNINMSLNDYYLNYIKLNRIDNNRILNTLKGMCERRNNKKGNL